MNREKRSLSLHGHRTSVALEPEFWAVIDRIVAERNLALAALIQKIDDERVQMRAPSGLASYLRVWVLKQVYTI